MILQFAIPSIIAMVLNAFVTIVDGFYLGNYIGEEGLSAVTIGLPIIYIYLAFGIMIGVGGISLAGRLLGEQNLDKANQVFRQTLWTIGIKSLILTALAFILFPIVMATMDIDVSVSAYMNRYFPIMFITYALMTINITMGMFIRGEGKPEVFMKISILTVGINILLDFLFIAKFGWGIRGIALASLISVLIGFVIGLRYFYRSSTVFKFGRIHFSKAILLETILNGSSELIGQLSLALATFAYNWAILREVGVSGIAAFTVLGYSAYVFNMLVIGFGQGASPLMSFAYGANERKLTQEIRKLTSYYVLASGIIIFIGLQLSANVYSLVFVQSQAIQELVQDGIRIFPIAFIILGINVIGSFYFTSIGKAKESALISALRGLVILLLAIIILPILWGMQGVWLVAPVTELLTLLVTIRLLMKDKYDLEMN